MSLFLSFLRFYILKCYFIQIQVQNQIIHNNHNSVFLAGAWPSWTKAAKTEIDTCAILLRNGKPELSLDSSTQLLRGKISSIQFLVFGLFGFHSMSSFRLWVEKKTSKIHIKMFILFYHTTSICACKFLHNSPKLSIR